jgi:Protein of unknown function (DUF2442)
MSILPTPIKVEFDEVSMCVTLDDGRTVGVPLAWFPRLLKGSSEERLDFFLSPSGIHWEKLDEDISVKMILAGRLSDDGEVRAAA